MRLTNSVMTARVLSDIQASYARMAKTSEQISSGKTIAKPSDDPLAAAQLRRQRSELESLDRFSDAADTAASWMTGAESGLDDVTDALQRARELTLQGAGTNLQQKDRDRIAQEIDQLAASVKDALSRKQGDAYLFSGTATTTAPYTAATGDVPQGDNGAVVRDIGPGVSVQLNVQTSALPAGTTAPLTAATIGGDGTDGRVLGALRTLATHLRSGDTASIGTSDLRALDANLTVVNDARTALGVQQNRVDAAKSRIEDLRTAADGVRSDLEDTDYATALTSITLQQTAYQAALKAGAQIIQPSLLDFLR